MLRKIIKEKRKKRGYTQEELAKKLNIRRATISDYEAGKTELRANTIDSIFSILKLEVKEKVPDIKPVYKYTYEEINNVINKNINHDKNKKFLKIFDDIAQTYFSKWKKDNWQKYLIPDEVYNLLHSKNPSLAITHNGYEKHIHLKESLFDDQKLMKGIIIHEISHAVCGINSSHGEKFKQRILKSIDKALDVKDEELAIELFNQHFCLYIKKEKIRLLTFNMLKETGNKALNRGFNRFYDTLTDIVNLENPEKTL